MECFHCDSSIPEGKTLCGGCHMVTYCGVECQRADWESSHREHCFDVYEPSLEAITALIVANYEDAEEDIRELEHRYERAVNDAERDEVLADAMEQWSPMEWPSYWERKRGRQAAKWSRKEKKRETALGRAGARFMKKRRTKQAGRAVRKKFERRLL